MTDRLFRQEQEIFSLNVDETAKAHLLETARWSKFLAVLSMILTIVLFVFIIISLTLSSSTLGALGSTGSAMVGLASAVVGLLFFAAIYFYPIWALFKFAKLTKSGILTANQQEFNEGLRFQKGLYKYIGILTIIVLALYGILLAIMLLGLAVSGA